MWLCLVLGAILAATGCAARLTGVSGPLAWQVTDLKVVKHLVAGEPRDLADRAWHAGPGYRDIAMLFIQARERLTSDGRMYVLFSSDSDLDLLGRLISRAGFVARLVSERSIFIESLIIYELRLQG